MSDERHLRCPYCGDTFMVELVYTARYSEHRDLDGFSCNNYECLATWDEHGNLTQAPHGVKL